MRFRSSSLNRIGSLAAKLMVLATRTLASRPCWKPICSRQRRIGRMGSCTYLIWSSAAMNVLQLRSVAVVMIFWAAKIRRHGVCSPPGAHYWSLPSGWQCTRLARSRACLAKAFILNKAPCLSSKSFFPFHLLSHYLYIHSPRPFSSYINVMNVFFTLQEFGLQVKAHFIQTKFYFSSVP